MVVPNTSGPVSALPIPPNPHAPHFRQRRQPSISIGGPPKAALGGPQRKPLTPQPQVVAPDVTPQGRKIAFKLPAVETRYVIKVEDLPEFVRAIVPEMYSKNPYVEERTDEDVAVALPIKVSRFNPRERPLLT